MYSTCLFCNTPLGSNEVLETFPVGRRIAFDARHGRLWVVCKSCERWNLTAIEERWEVIDACEKLYRDARTRVATQNIGLARLHEGLELVRIGKPLWPEFAGWRYGDQFGRRRLKRVLVAGSGVGALAALGLGAAGTGVAMLALSGTFWQVTQRIVYGNPDSVVARIPIDDRWVEITRRQLDRIRMIGDRSDPWRLQLLEGSTNFIFHDRDAHRAAALLLPRLNQFGGNKNEVKSAIGLIERAGDPLQYVNVVTTSLDARMGKPMKQLPYPMRLALEMAAHEDAERRVLEGELKALELAWREAEEVAGISDNMFLPAFITEAIERFKK
jgi:hypothetical protein